MRGSPTGRFRGICGCGGCGGRFCEEISLFLAQSEETAERLVQMGAPAERVRVTGNLKYDVRAATASALTEMMRERLPVRAKAGGCGKHAGGRGEDACWRRGLRCWRRSPDAVMVLAPRHPDRFDAVCGHDCERGLCVDAVRASSRRTAAERWLRGAYSSAGYDWGPGVDVRDWRRWRLWGGAWCRRVGIIRWSLRSLGCRW